MKKLHLFIIGILLNCSFDASASSQKESQNPNDYLDGHYIYPRHFKRGNQSINVQQIVCLLPRTQIAPLAKNKEDSFYWHSNAKYLKPQHFPASTQGHLAYCWSSELNYQLKNNYRKAQELDLDLAEQYKRDLQDLQFIKKAQFKNYRDHHKFPSLSERPKINPYGAIGQKYQYSLNSPTGITQYQSNYYY